MSVVTPVPTTTPTAVQAALAEAEGVAPTVVVEGVLLTLRSPVPMGALSVFAARLQDPNPLVQASAYVRFMKAWVVPEQHGLVDVAVESVVDMEAFATDTITRFVEAGTARPT